MPTRNANWLSAPVPDVLKKLVLEPICACTSPVAGCGPKRSGRYPVHTRPYACSARSRRSGPLVPVARVRVAQMHVRVARACRHSRRKRVFRACFVCGERRRLTRDRFEARVRVQRPQRRCADRVTAANAERAQVLDLPLPMVGKVTLASEVENAGTAWPGKRMSVYAAPRPNGPFA